MRAAVAIHITRVNDTANDIPLPRYATENSAGMDLCAALDEELVMRPGETVLVPTGFAIALPEWYEAQVRPRSGLAIKHQVGILNSPGTIDADYRGEIKIVLINLSGEQQVIMPGDRIAQMIIQKVEKAVWKEAEEISVTTRNTGGFGHTGL